MIAQKLVILRKQNKLTQVQVAKALGVERSTYNKYEKGDRQVSVSTLKKLSDFYRVPFSLFVENSDNVLMDEDKYEKDDVCYLSQLSKDERALVAEYRTLSAEEKKNLKEFIKNK